MKRSKYTFIIEKESKFIMYNCWTEKMALLEAPLKDLIEEGDMQGIQQIHPDFYNYLVDKKFIVSSETNEFKKITELWEKVDNDESVLTLIINPTMDCNMRCWYCYEKREKGTVLNEKVYEAIIKLSQQKLQTDNFRRLNLCFFGGEPLLVFHKKVYPLMKKLSELCNIYNKEFYANFITNAYLLTDDVIEKMQETKVNGPISFQITLDGNEDYHNETRHTATKAGSYQQIIQNTKNALRHNMPVILRLNCTVKNIKSYLDVLSDLSDLSEAERKNIKIDMQHVWQDRSTSSFDFEELQNEVRNKFTQEGFFVMEKKHIDISRCYADQQNNIAINYNGDLYNCTAREFNDENKEGKLTETGLLEWNEKRTLRMALKYGNATCQSCRIYPLCHGNCSQFKLENQEKMGCIRGYSKDYMLKIVEDRIDFILNRTN